MNYFFIILFVILIIGIVALLYIIWRADLKFFLAVRKIRRTERKKEVCCKDIVEFNQQLIKASIRMMDSGIKDEFPTLLDYTIVGRFRKTKQYVDPVSLFRFQYSECGWIIYSILEYTLRNNQEFTNTTTPVYCAENQLFIKIKRYVDDKILDAEFETVDQAQCGMIALLLYEKTQEEKYRIYADEMYKWVLTFDTIYGVLYRPNHNRIVVDSIGMAIPFLIKNAQVFNIPQARQVALKAIEKYVIFGCDSKTGVPVYAYEMNEPYLKLGRANWGRGISWFVIGLSCIDNNELNADVQPVIEKLDNTLKKVWDRDKSFGQFIGQSASHDLSAELPIIYYLTKKKIINLTKDEVLNYSLMMHDGVMYNSSSSYTGIIQYGVPVGPNMLSQAFMIRLLNIYED